MERLAQIEDRWLMVALTLAVLIGFTITRDPLMGDVFKVLVGGTITIFSRRADKLVVVDPAESKQIFDEFLRRNN